LTPIAVRVEDVKGCTRGKPSLQVYAAVIIADSLCKVHACTTIACLCYHALNKATVKNQNPLPVISEMLENEREVSIFTKRDLRGAYNLIRIQQEDDYKTAFRKGDGQL